MKTNFLKIFFKEQILIRIENGMLFLTCRDYDIYDRKNLFAKITNTKIEFAFNGNFYSIKEYLHEDCNCVINNTEKVPIQMLTKEQYYKITRFDRRELLLENYQKSHSKAIDFKYIFSHSNYIKLSEDVKLEKWIDKSNEINMINSILKWLKLNCEHNGNLFISSNNSLEILQYADENNRQINCKGFAVLFNDIVLTLGSHCRIIKCLPKDQTGNNCHFVNSVYLKSIGKWIFVDPTFSLYTFDTKTGYILSLQEIRECLSLDRDIIFNNEASYFGKQLSKMLYLKAQVRNFYCLCSPRVSTFNGLEKKELVTLVPQISFHKYYEIQTDNPEAFWEKPI